MLWEFYAVQNAVSIVAALTRAFEDLGIPVSSWTTLP